MFTGLVETKGCLAERIDQPPGKRLRIDAGLDIAADARVGDSICCNGCCLTVVAIEGTILDFEAGAETLSRTNLGRVEPGWPINLERSLPVGGRLGGHYVSGHIDALAELIRSQPDPPWAKLWFRVPDRWARQIAPKGSVALDGVSLTVVDVEGPRVRIQGTFQHAPTGTQGSYLMRGNCSPSNGRMTLIPQAWVQQPPGYIMVGLSGVVTNNGQSFTGRMLHRSCGEFTFSRP